MTRRLVCIACVYPSSIHLGESEMPAVMREAEVLRCPAGDRQAISCHAASTAAAAAKFKAFTS
jgi:hypothetical protein